MRTLHLQHIGVTRLRLPGLIRAVSAAALHGAGPDGDAPPSRPRLPSHPLSLSLLQDSSVLRLLLPIFHRPPSTEQDQTVMRPHDSDCVALTVQPAVVCLEPDSPRSVDHLLEPQSPEPAEPPHPPGPPTADPRGRERRGSGHLPSDPLLPDRPDSNAEPLYGNVFSYRASGAAPPARVTDSGGGGVASAPTAKSDGGGTSADPGDSGVVIDLQGEASKRNAWL